MADIANIASMVESPKKTMEKYGIKSSRAIQLTPKSRFRIINKFRTWWRNRKIQKEVGKLNEDLSHLEERKAEFSKSKYMIDQGAVDRVQRKIDRVQRQISVLLEEKDIINSGVKLFEKKKKPLRLLPRGYRELKDTYHISSAHIAAAKFHRASTKSPDLVEVATTIDQHQQGINETLRQEIDSKGKSLSIEEQEVKDTIDAYLEETRSHLQEEVKGLGVTSNTNLSGSILGSETRVRPLQGYETPVKSIVDGSNEVLVSDKSVSVKSDGNSGSEEVKPINFNPDLTDESSILTSDKSSVSTSKSSDYDINNSALNIDKYASQITEIRKRIAEQKEKKNRSIEECQASNIAKETALKNASDSDKRVQELVSKYTIYMQEQQKKIDSDIQVEAEQRRQIEENQEVIAEALEKQRNNEDFIASLQRMMELPSDMQEEIVPKQM